MIPYITFYEIGGVIGTLVVGVGSLRMKDLIQRGLAQRRLARLGASGALASLPAGRIPCPECAEAILPEARRCPYCRSAVTSQR
ncbi:MAG: hypothetical protein ABJE47_16380 [bacterium]